MTAVGKALLVAHIVTSVGWLGAAIAFLGLAAAALSSSDPTLVRAAFLGMESMMVFALVPLTVAAVPIGVAQSIASPWGLFRHYWVLVKLGLTLAAAIVLFQYPATMSHIARLAADPSTSLAELRSLALSPAVHAGGGLVVLTFATILSVFKPRGITPYGWRKQNDERQAAQRRAAPEREVLAP